MFCSARLTHVRGAIVAIARRDIARVAVATRLVRSTTANFTDVVQMLIISQIFDVEVGDKSVGAIFWHGATFATRWTVDIGSARHVMAQTRGAEAM